MSYAAVNGIDLYYELHGSARAGKRPLVLLHGGLLTIGLTFGPLLGPLAEDRQLIAVELQGHGHTADTDRPMTIDALAGDVVALLDELGVAEADFFGFSLGGLVSCALAARAPDRVGRLIVASADAHRPPGRESAPITEDRLPTMTDFKAMQDGYAAVAPDPGQFEKSAARTTAMVHEVPGMTAEQLAGLRAPTLLIFGDRDFWPLTDVAELYGMLPDARLAVLPDTTHMRVTQRPELLLALVTPFLDGR
jgi:pimeloyl-ACP methyl ester carboxylesterase